MATKTEWNFLNVPTYRTVEKLIVKLTCEQADSFGPEDWWNLLNKLVQETPPDIEVVLDDEICSAQDIVFRYMEVLADKAPHVLADVLVEYDLWRPEAVGVCRHCGGPLVQDEHPRVIYCYWCGEEVWREDDEW